MPMERAVPTIVAIASFMSMVFKSSIFILAISSTCLTVKEPITSLPAIPEAFANLALFLINADVGGVLMIKSNDLSLYTVMTTGNGRGSLPLVLSLKDLQNIMMLTPCCPSAGPTGGAGLAWPAGTYNLICATTSFAIISSYIFSTCQY